MDHAPWRVEICGVVGAGKSTLICSVFEHLRRHGHSVAIHELDVWSDTHDVIFGRKRPEDRKKRKKAWTYPTIANAANRFAEDDHAIVLGDLAGSVNAAGIDLLVAPAHAGIIVTRTFRPGLVQRPGIPRVTEEALAALWEKRFRKHGIPFVLRIFSHAPDEPCTGHPPGILCVRGTERMLRDDEDIARIADRLLRAHREALRQREADAPPVRRTA